MRAAALSAEAWRFGGIRPRARGQDAVAEEIAPAPVAAWNAEAFAEEQIRGLVRQVFSPALDPPVQQVVFSAIEPGSDVRFLSRWVAEVLAHETTGDIVVLDESEMSSLWSTAFSPESSTHVGYRARSVRKVATRIRKNVWTLPSADAGSLNGPSLCTYMAEVRREFEYSIVAAPAASLSKTLELARFADGIILVLSAQKTRRVAALRVKNALAKARLLGTVLSDREFPMPASLYRRL